MTVDLEAIARRTNCEPTSLRNALPLLEQGYAPPFLARYRRDELGGLSEQAMWTLYRAMRDEAWIKNRREDLVQRLEQMPQADPALGRAIRSASSKRVLDRLARRVRTESAESHSPAMRVAARILSPEKGDPSDVAGIAELLGLSDSLGTIEAQLDQALASRLAGHPQMQSTAVRWLFNNAKINVVSVKDTHLESASAADDDASGEDSLLASSDVPTSSTEATQKPPKKAKRKGPFAANLLEPAAATAPTPATEAASPDATESAPSAAEAVRASAEAGATADADQPASKQEEQTGAPVPTPEGVDAEPVAQEGAEQATPKATVADVSEPVAAEAAATELTSVDTVATDASATEVGSTEAAAAEPAEGGKKDGSGRKKDRSRGKDKSKPKGAPKAKEPKSLKKISPRQRRRRWLVSVLQPLAGKVILAQKLTAFQTLMIGRGLRSGVVQCQFVYDTEKLNEQLLRTAGGLNEAFADRLRDIVVKNDASIREAAEAAWWDELLEGSATRLVGVAADHLESQINRSGVDAKVILSIDAMGPRTAAIAVVAADGRLIHTEDIPCQLTTAMRSAAVTRVGELIHQYGVDLIVISNGPARRACLVILHELVEQSTPGSIRWTIAERSGADVYAGSEIGNREMRSTPRRFRSAAWLAFSVLRPSQAVTKVDPLRLRLGSFQRELSEDALWPALRDVMTSGVSRGGVDVNAAPVDWLSQLPGVTHEVASAIDKRRRDSLFTSRAELAALEQWGDAKDQRQALAFLRVFGSEEPLDGTLIHPDDYVLAKKLATALKLELPPSTPPGYQKPSFEEPVATPIHEPIDLASKVEEVVIAMADKDFAAEIQPEGVADEAAEDAVATESLEATESSDAVEATASESNDEAAVATSSDEPTDAAPAKDSVAVLERVRQPMPDAAAISKCVKEWQIGSRRARMLVDALCDPFGDEDTGMAGAAHAVMTKVPKLADLSIGEQVIGVIVGVTEFGAFVEMSPECSGLIHVSRVADRYVEDLHEAVQVGDVITAWVTNIDTKRRRVGLSAISPEREAELDRQRQERREESSHRGGYQGSRPPRGDQRGGQGRGDQRGAAPRGDRASDSRSAQPAGAGASGGQAARGDSRGRSDSRPDNRGGRGDSRQPAGKGGPGGKGGSGRDYGRGGQRGGRRDRDDRDDGPTSYSTRVTRSDTPATPITEAMAKGDEPLRSFGDLMQFFKKAQPEPVVKPKVVEPKASADPLPASEQSAAPEVKSETPSSPASGADGENPAT